jgi:hypothetical protein
MNIIILYYFVIFIKYSKQSNLIKIMYKYLLYLSNYIILIHPLRLESLQAFGSPNLHYNGSNFSAFFFLLSIPIKLWARK